MQPQRVKHTHLGLHLCNIDSCLQKVVCRHFSRGTSCCTRCIASPPPPTQPCMQSPAAMPIDLQVKHGSIDVPVTGLEAEATVRTSGRAPSLLVLASSAAALPSALTPQACPPMPFPCLLPAPFLTPDRRTEGSVGAADWGLCAASEDHLQGQGEVQLGAAAVFAVHHNTPPPVSTPNTHLENTNKVLEDKSSLGSCKVGGAKLMLLVSATGQAAPMAGGRGKPAAKPAATPGKRLAAAAASTTGSTLNSSSSSSQRAVTLPERRHTWSKMGVVALRDLGLTEVPPECFEGLPDSVRNADLSQVGRWVLGGRVGACTQGAQVKCMQPAPYPNPNLNTPTPNRPKTHTTQNRTSSLQSQQPFPSYHRWLH